MCTNCIKVGSCAQCLLFVTHITSSESSVPMLYLYLWTSHLWKCQAINISYLLPGWSRFLSYKALLGNIWTLHCILLCWQQAHATSLTVSPHSFVVTTCMASMQGGSSGNVEHNVKHNNAWNNARTREMRLMWISPLPWCILGHFPTRLLPGCSFLVLLSVMVFVFIFCYFCPQLYIKGPILTI